MRWEGRAGSTNVEDRRGGRSRRGLAVGGVGGLVLLLGIFLLGQFTGVDVSGLLGALSGGAPPTQSAPPAAQDELARFVSVILADTEQTWTPIFAQQGRRYQPARLVLFSDEVQSACGRNSAAIGPFYCPADRSAYIDLSFYRDLDQRFGAPGDFAQAYVLAHEVGHHVQNLTGVNQRARAMERGAGEVQRNRISVQVELQADCYAGVWAHYAHRERQMLEPGDLEEGLRAAAAIGDDTIQNRSRGRSVPESFTHGSAQQRVRWFRRGFGSGQMGQCDTFSVAQL